MKDLFVPFREQKMKMQKWRRYGVHVHIDEDSFRIMASAKVERYLSKDKPPYKAGDPVDLLIWQRTELGYKAIVDNRFSGLLYANEVFRTLEPGLKLEAYVKQVRPDGKIDLELQRGGARKVDDFADTLLAFIVRNCCFTPFNDKSPAEEIYATFGVSKKTFKKAVGELYRKRLILIEEDGLRASIDD